MLRCSSPVAYRAFPPRPNGGKTRKQLVKNWGGQNQAASAFAPADPGTQKEARSNPTSARGTGDSHVCAAMTAAAFTHLEMNFLADFGNLHRQVAYLAQPKRQLLLRKKK